MSRGASVQKQVLLIMDSLVTSIVTEICQLDIFQSKCQIGNPETDIKMVSSFKMYNELHFNVCTDVNSFTFTKNKQTGSHSYRENIQ